MKRRILLPTDFSINARNAIDYAINLYKEETCDFYLLNTYSVNSFALEMNTAMYLEESEKKSISGLKKILKSLQAMNDGAKHQFHIISECGYLINAIVDIVEKHDINIVVMGTKGHSDASIEIYGSQAVLVMEKIRNCPVLAIPKQTIFRGIKEIVFPTSYKTHYKQREFQYLVDIAKITNSAIRILHVFKKGKNLNEDQRNNKKLLKDYFEGLAYTFHTTHHIKVQIALNTFIESRGSDMVAFINKKHNFFTTLFSEPMVKSLGYHSTIPVLALHDFRN